MDILILKNFNEGGIRIYDGQKQDEQKDRILLYTGRLEGGEALGGQWQGRTEPHVDGWTVPGTLQAWGWQSEPLEYHGGREGQEPHRKSPLRTYPAILSASPQQRQRDSPWVRADL